MQRRRGESAARTEISWACFSRFSRNRFTSTSFRSQFRDSSLFRRSFRKLARGSVEYLMQTESDVFRVVVSARFLLLLLTVCECKRKTSRNNFKKKSANFPKASKSSEKSRARVENVVGVSGGKIESLRMCLCGPQRWRSRWPCPCPSSLKKRKKKYSKIEKRKLWKARGKA